FAETAALVEALDLVITVDTSVAHLAGALGRAVWLLLPMQPDFRWLLERADSPWYPSLHLFRQQRPGDWQGVFQRLREALQKLLSHPGKAVAQESRWKGGLPAMSTVTETLAAAVWAHQAGDLRQAEQLYRHVLQAEPQHVDALHLLGVLAQQAGR